MRHTFSDSWYRIADLRIALRPGIVTRQHRYRGEVWYVLYERAHSGFFRVNSTTYLFLRRLTVDSTIHEIWREAVNSAPEETPGQEEVFELIVSLYRANLVYVEGGVDESKILDRSTRKKRKSLTARLSELPFVRIPLWNPNRWLNRWRGWIEWLFGWPLGLIVWVVVWGLIEFIFESSRLWNQAHDILQLNNLPLLYIAVFISHFFHEMGHAATCKYYGGDVRTMGVMLLLLTPMPYVDVSSSWSFRNRWHRIMVDAAGVGTDLVTGAFATILWAYSPPGIFNELCYNLVFAIWVHTFIFNMNPLMRFDGYYILSDWIDIPNLHEQAKQAFQHVWATRVLGVSDADGDWHSPRRRLGLVLYYLFSNFYRLLVMVGIVFFVADQYFGFGLVVAIALAQVSFIVPLKSWLRPLKNPMFIHQQKTLLQTVGIVLVVVLGIGMFVPVSDNYVLDGVVEAQNNTPIHSKSGGIVEQVAVTLGHWVKAGTLLVVLSNPEITYELEGVMAQLRQAEIQESKALTDGGVELDPIMERKHSLLKVKESLEKQQKALKFFAPHDGYWLGGDIQYWRSSWVGRGVSLGRVVDDRTHLFIGIVRQEAALALTEMQLAGSRVRLEGERGLVYGIKTLRLLPHSQSVLPSASLGPAAGGNISVKANDSSGKQAAEAFFMLRAKLDKASGDAMRTIPMGGRSGWIQVSLGSRPLLVQWWRAINQFFQRRYSL